ncbi:unnamed protein product [Cyclocybe aegerita]|uniref:Uncharacterized protein n=1 Tax=Cyclocybe aegerita TaxID=1973307 RepID=A0A8S0W6X0_CYCAE|nr:unnamed protein product [Cyclocybe aegerita]
MSRGTAYCAYSLPLGLCCLFLDAVFLGCLYPLPCVRTSDEAGNFEGSQGGAIQPSTEARKDLCLFSSFDSYFGTGLARSAPLSRRKVILSSSTGHLQFTVPVIYAWTENEISSGSTHVMFLVLAI